MNLDVANKNQLATYLVITIAVQQMQPTGYHSNASSDAIMRLIVKLRYCMHALCTNYVIAGSTCMGCQIASIVAHNTVKHSIGVW